jgi:YHS domain-containing protein
MRKRTLNLFFVVAGAILVVLVSSTSVWGSFEKGQTCPVMPGRPVKEKFFVDYNGKRIYLCCAPCVKAFKKHPEKYLKNLKEKGQAPRIST